MTSKIESSQPIQICLGDQNTVDVFFVFKNGNQRIASHKKILASKSDVFNKMFYGESKRIEESKLIGEIEIADSTAERFTQFLQSFYDDKMIIKNMTSENIAEILFLAHKYNVSHCDQFLLPHVNGKNALSIMKSALLYNNEEVIEQCSFEISADVYGILEEDEFLDCSSDVLQCFLEHINTDDFSRSIYNRVPAEICEACVRWAQRRCEEQNIDSSISDNLRGQLRDFFEDIPFAYMKRSDFYDFLANYADLFKPNEIKDISNRI